jgi:hypothetical protein
MRQLLLPVLLLGAPIAPLTAIAADDLKVSQLEQDVRELQRQVLAQAQQITQLRAQLNRPASAPVASPARSPQVSAGKSEIWLDASRWALIKPGMGELEVVSLLGPPTSMREKDGDRQLLYAMEIGASGFLSGSVTLRDRVVLKSQKPELR